jgi:hypothetical protein
VPVIIHTVRRSGAVAIFFFFLFKKIIIKVFIPSSLSVCQALFDSSDDASFAREKFLIAVSITNK